MTEDLGRWGSSDSRRDCSSCGRYIRWTYCPTDGLCPECASGIVASEPKTLDPRDGAEGYCPMYPPLTAEEMASLRKDKRYGKRTATRPGIIEAEAVEPRLKVG